ncbi:MAG: RNB domain-containing ribonuclease [Treponemataceae bacterium]|nr:RNB domain-containing ribonuclease [Treponemataceae bacterium]
MLSINSFVLYKNTLAIITEKTEDKYNVMWQVCPASQGGKKAQYANQKVREKDVILIAAAPEKNSDSSKFPNLEKSMENALNTAISDDYKAKIKECWELISSDDESASENYSLQDLMELSLGTVEINSIFAFYKTLNSTFFFKQDISSSANLIYSSRKIEEIEELEKKEFEKQNAGRLQDEFIQRLKENKIKLPEDSTYMQEIEAFVLGKTDKSKYLSLAKLPNNIEKAHKLLLDTGFWTIWKNPYPSRYGLTMTSAKTELESPPEEERLTVNHTAYAIDNESSDDPDDAIAFDGEYVWVHIADPASSVKPDSKIDIEARKRGTTLYMPEGISRMISDGCLTDYALGLSEESKALSFKIKLDDKANIIESDIQKTIVKVKRFTYKQANSMQDSAELKELFIIADRYRQKRNAAGAVNIELPQVDVRLSTKDDGSKEVIISPDEKMDSKEMVKELMLMAGEAASKFAFQNNIPFPYISTEAPDIPEKLPEGLAGQFALRRCMHGRRVTVTPSMHCSLGLSTYCQVTSPLRRYIDLIAHQQLRLFLEGKPLINKDDVLERISTGDAGIAAANKASRSSDMHFKLVYLLQNPQWQGKAVAVETRQNMVTFIIPELGLETQITNRNYQLNQEITLKVSKIYLPELKVDFIEV